MAYTKTTWKNRLVEKPKTFRKQDNADGTLTLIPAEGNIIEAGTPVNAVNMNKIEEALSYHDSKIVDMVTKTGVETLTNKTLTTPKITGSINDTNGNELIKLEQTSSAVNEITIKNNVAGQAPQIKTSGNDTNIDINLVPKGNGRLKESGANVLLENKVGVSNGIASLGADGKVPSSQLPEPFKTEHGTFNINNLEIEPAATYTKTIPLGVNAKKGRILMSGAMSSDDNTGQGALIFFNKTESNSCGITILLDKVRVFKPGKHLISDDLQIFGRSIALKNCYIDGNNLVLTFFCNSAYNKGYIIVSNAYWEVE